MWVHPLSKTGQIMDGHFIGHFITPQTGDLASNDTHWAVTHRGKGLGKVPDAVNDKSIGEVVNRIAKKTNALIRLPPDSDEGRENAKKLKEEYKSAFETFAERAGKDLALRVKRSVNVNPEDGNIAVDWD